MDCPQNAMNIDDRIQDLIIKKLLINENYSFIYDSRHVHHGYTPSIDSFFTMIRNETQKEVNIDKTAKSDIEDNSGMHDKVIPETNDDLQKMRKINVTSLKCSNEFAQPLFFTKMVRPEPRI
ncbi:uncharacterized protein LOC116416504 [Nasonia vitripennis]|uniref:Uncharacterized protein n=1 Tax=Nasonia vitripennis TaxID=7425 RepID=A0A7M7Q358_NASVI|nr:uncharacterized protein LOC116416504 [Nasonia vitripennis]